jgi:transposase
MVFSVRVSVPGKSLVSPQELTLPTGTDGGVHFRPWLRSYRLLLPAQTRRQDKIEGKKRYCFVAIDRATRLSLLAVYDSKTKKAATDFLTQCLVFFPFRISKVLTDNGREFTLKGFKNRWGTTVKDNHDFEKLCRQQEIEHRTTLPYTPKTNGMVERMNGLTKENTVKKKRYVTVREMLVDLHGWFVRYTPIRP